MNSTTASVHTRKRTESGRITPPLHRDVWFLIIMCRYVPIDEVLKLKRVNKEMNDIAEKAGLRLLHAGMPEAEQRAVKREYEGMLLEFKRELCVRTPAYVDSLADHIRRQPEEHRDNINHTMESFFMEVHSVLGVNTQTMIVAWHYMVRLLADRIVHIGDVQYYVNNCILISVRVVERREVDSMQRERMHHLIPDFDKNNLRIVEDRCRGLFGASSTTHPNVSDFMGFFVRAARLEQHAELHALLCLLAQTDEEIRSERRPSLVAAAAVMCTRQVIGGETWDKILTGYTGYEEDEVHGTARMLMESVRAMYQKNLSSLQGRHYTASVPLLAAYLGRLPEPV